jgi:hypothetical protein
LVRSSGNIIGGTTAGAATSSPAITADGVHLDVLARADNRVQGNYIGTDATGQADLGNSRYGCGSGTHNTVGGTV